METAQEALARVYAGRELNRIDLLRSCAAARVADLKQDEIAQRLQISQAEVSRILRKIRNFPELLEVTPREIILDFHAGRMRHGEMLQQLKDWQYTFSKDAEPDNPEGALTGGSWDDVVDAFHRDLIDMEDYQEIRQVVLRSAATS
ncbi:hypothetical protein [Arthrobacter glacialis]|uniref:Uncharacterized protein n=1 Tax=Arthrobacter glacialis TaxID=1664 RepID=A0A2S3ZT85_ARTGL|nr:hypothetical protein [Arthrobacter glacialis]POH72476.1 hypothetical protein CVS27_15200 [Arthrobacter glacialis]